MEETFVLNKTNILSSCTDWPTNILGILLCKSFSSFFHFSFSWQALNNCDWKIREQSNTSQIEILKEWGGVENEFGLDLSVCVFNCEGEENGFIWNQRILCVPWCASWPFSASSEWCVSCCLDPKAPASSTAPSRAVVWHVCKAHKHRMSQHTSTTRNWESTYAKETAWEDRIHNMSPTGRNKYCDFHVPSLVLDNTCSEASDWTLRRFGFTCDFELDRETFSKSRGRTEPLWLDGFKAWHRSSSTTKSRACCNANLKSWL